MADQEERILAASFFVTALTENDTMVGVTVNHSCPSAPKYLMVEFDRMVGKVNESHHAHWSLDRNVLPVDHTQELRVPSSSLGARTICQRVPFSTVMLMESHIAFFVSLSTTISFRTLGHEKTPKAGCFRGLMRA